MFLLASETFSCFREICFSCGGTIAACVAGGIAYAMAMFADENELRSHEGNGKQSASFARVILPGT